MCIQELGGTSHNSNFVHPRIFDLVFKAILILFDWGKTPRWHSSQTVVQSITKMETSERYPATLSTLYFFCAEEDAHYRKSGMRHLKT